MNKLEFMAMSLPYGLKFMLNQSNRIIELTEVCISTGIYEGVYRSHGIAYAFGGTKPILRPLSELIKEIEHKGETFIPIVELAKTCDSVNGFWKLKQEENISAIRYIDSEGITTVLAYHWETQSFGANSCIDNHFEKFTNVHRQLQMFQKLIEWHFDIAGLIDKNEAIDYSTLEGFIF